MHYIKGSIQENMEKLNFSPENTYILGATSSPESKTPGTVFIYADQKTPCLVDLYVSTIPYAIQNELESCLEGLYDYFEHTDSPVNLLFEVENSCLAYNNEKFFVNKLFHFEKEFNNVRVFVFYS